MSKQQRREALGAALIGRNVEFPDTPTGVGFDGGVRQPVPEKGTPEEEHARVLTELVRLAQLQGSAPGW
jgi:hypothetical protein